MKLYGYSRSSAAYRVRIALNLKEIAYEAVSINLLKKEQSGPMYWAVNPQARGPALALGGTVLMRSPAIREYWEGVSREPPLLPADPIARARVRAACALIGC